MLSVICLCGTVKGCSQLFVYVVQLKGAPVISLCGTVEGCSQCFFYVAQLKGAPSDLSMWYS